MRSSAIFPANRAKPGSLVGISTVGGLGRHFVPQVGVVMAVTPMKWPGWGRQRHALAAFGADTALMWGNRSGVGRWESGQEEDLSMVHRLVFAPARPAACALAMAAATTILTPSTPSPTFAQPPPPTPPPRPAPRHPLAPAGTTAAPRAAPRAAPAQKPAEPPAPQAPQQPQAQAEQPQLIFSPWTKFCLKGQEANAKQVCFTGKDGRVESG